MARELVLNLTSELLKWSKVKDYPIWIYRQILVKYLDPQFLNTFR